VASEVRKKSFGVSSFGVSVVSVGSRHSRSFGPRTLGGACPDRFPGTGQHGPVGESEIGFNCCRGSSGSASWSPWLLLASRLEVVRLVLLVFALLAPHAMEHMAPWWKPKLVLIAAGDRPGRREAAGGGHEVDDSRSLPRDAQRQCVVQCYGQIAPDRRGRFRVYFCRASGEGARQILTLSGHWPHDGSAMRNCYRNLIACR
jgi:hypothetical protein